jgi:hypothetical protein
MRSLVGTLERCLASSFAKAMADRCEAVVSRETSLCHALHSADLYRLAIENGSRGVVIVKIR